MEKRSQTFTHRQEYEPGQCTRKSRRRATGQTQPNGNVNITRISDKLYFLVDKDRGNEEAGVFQIICTVVYLYMIPTWRYFLFNVVYFRKSNRDPDLLLAFTPNYNNWTTCNSCVTIPM